MEADMEDHKQVWMTALHQALVLSLAAAFAECARLRPGAEEEVLATCRLAIEKDLGPPDRSQSEEAEAFRATVFDAMTTILDVAEEKARDKLGKRQPTATMQ